MRCAAKALGTSPGICMRIEALSALGQVLTRRLCSNYCMSLLDPVARGQVTRSRAAPMRWVASNRPLLRTAMRVAEICTYACQSREHGPSESRLHLPWLLCTRLWCCATHGGGYSCLRLPEVLGCRRASHTSRHLRQRMRGMQEASVSWSPARRVRLWQLRLGPDWCHFTLPETQSRCVLAGSLLMGRAAWLGR